MPDTLLMLKGDISISKIGRHKYCRITDEEGIRRTVSRQRDGFSMQTKLDTGKFVHHYEMKETDVRVAVQVMPLHILEENYLRRPHVLTEAEKLVYLLRKG